MKLQFDSNQAYQLRAIASIVDIFKGQPLQTKDFEIQMKAPEDQLQMGQNFVIGNKLLLAEETLLKNLQAVQTKNELEKSEKLDGLNFSVEMETGTGKTYVYLRTIHELYQNYGFKKFVIVVPSIAIKEGVLKNLQITADHFSKIYESLQMDFSVYDSKQSNGRKRSIVRNFARNNSLQILVINIDSFAKDSNIINQISEDGIKPVELLQATNPVVIVDEPQNMETEIRKTAIENLNPLCTLRYSATHKYHYNLCYKLDPVQAYDLGLVKKIEVDSVLAESGQNEAFIELVSLKPTSKTITIQLKIHVNDPKKGVVEKVVSIKKSPNGTSESDLYKLSNEREVYKTGYTISGYDVSSGSVSFTNGKTLYIGESQGEIKEDLMRFQIEQTVKNHFEKERKLKDKGIKVLTLFFIDKVANYREYISPSPQSSPIKGEEAFKKGKFAVWFEEIFEALQKAPHFADLIPHTAEKVHNGYFSADNKGILKDTKGNTKADDDTYSLIMKEKERLLSLDEPLRFIFSHSALREGWDNPNVFQICTLNESRSDAKKRQEIGRGLRLPVDQNGQRVFDRNLNILTVTANESYEDFAKSLQTEIENECGVNFGGRIKNKRERQKVTLRKGYKLDPNFKDLWERIKHQTRYRVDYKTENLIEKVASELKNISVPKPKIRNIKGGLDITKEGVEAQFLGGREVEIQRAVHQMPDILGYIQSRTHLTKDTILKILIEAGKSGEIFQNPQGMMDLAAQTINRTLNEMMVDGIKYERIAGRTYQMELFENEELEGYLENMVKVQSEDKTLYDYTLVDSDIESQFAKDLETDERVQFYLKLPAWFKIKTPIGSYNPDWAIVFEQDKRVYFVAETKGSLDTHDLRKPEKMKIRCGTKHFEQMEEVRFKQVIKVADIMV
jgi:type III restriction enzyme